MGWPARARRAAWICRSRRPARSSRRWLAPVCVAQGAHAILADQDAQRLAREALFLLVFGSRPTI